MHRLSILVCFLGMSCGCEDSETPLPDIAPPRSSVNTAQPPKPPSTSNEGGIGKTAQPKMSEFQFNLTTREESAADNLQTAYKNKDYETAITLLKEALRETPNNANLLTQIATCYFQQQDSSRALPYVQRALKSDPEYLPAIRLLGVLQLRRQRYSDCIQALSEYVEQSPAEADVLLWRAAAYLNTKQAESALQDIENALALSDVDQSTCYYLRAVGHYQLQQFEAAITAVTKARSLNYDEERLQTLTEQIEHALQSTSPAENQ